MAKINFKNGRVEDYTIVLSTRDYRHLGQLTKIKSESVQNSNHLNSANELSFTLYKEDLLKIPEIYNEEARECLLKEKEILWLLLVDHRLIWVKELDEYYEIKVSTDDGLETYKTITATSLCEAELSQYRIDSLEINTDVDFEVSAKTTYFCNFSEPEYSLLHRAIKDKAPHYTIGHVDQSLQDLKFVREFSVSGTSIYDFLTGEVADQFNCLFIFDSKTRTISVYDLYTVCTICGCREEFYEQCPNCGNADRSKMKYFGQDTTILVDKKNLTDSIRLETNADSVKNCLKMVAGDEVMSDAIRMLNQNGSDYLYYISELQMSDMPEELVSKLLDYQDKYTSYTEEHNALVLQYYDLTDHILYLQHSMMPTREIAEITAQTEADKLVATFTGEDPAVLGLNNVTEKGTSDNTVNSALANYAKIFIKTGYVKVEAHGKFKYEGEHTAENALDSYHYGYWTGTFTITNYSDEKDVVTTETLTIMVYDHMIEYARQHVLKRLTRSNNADSIFDVFNIADDDYFTKALKEYCYERLRSFRDAYTAALTVLNEMGVTGETYSEDDPNYDPEIDAYTKEIYFPYQVRQAICEEAMNRIQLDETFEYQMDGETFQDCITSLTEQYNTVVKRMEEIQSELNFQNYLGNDLYKIYCAYRREDTYENADFISDGLTNEEIIERAKQFIEFAHKELKRVAEPQYTISSTLKNLLVLKEFKPIVDYFELGNWIRVKVDGKIYTLRLIGYNINFGSIQDIEVEFSTVTKFKDVAYDAQQVIKSAQSMSSSFTYVAQQAKKGESAKSNVDDWINNGLNSALVNIKNSDETLIINDDGMLFRYKDIDTGQYDDEQLKIFNNKILFTKDNWKTCSQAIGKHSYTMYNSDINQFETYTGYGLTAEFVTAPAIVGTTLVGGSIYSSNYSNGNNDRDAAGSYIDLNNGEFNFGAGSLVFKDKQLKISNKAFEEAVGNLTVTPETLSVHAKNIDVSQGGIESNQIESLNSGKINWNTKIPADHIDENIVVKATNIDVSSGRIQSSQIESLASTKITGKLTSSQINSIDISQITGNIEADSVQASNIKGTIASNQIASGLENKSVTGSFEGSVTLSSVATVDANGTTYNTVSGEFTVGNMTLKFVNGLLVSANTAVTG